MTGAWLLPACQARLQYRMRLVTCLLSPPPLCLFLSSLDSTRSLVHPSCPAATNAVFDLEAMVDWMPPGGTEAAVAAAAAAAGTGPIFMGDNVATTSNYERYVWQAGSSPYKTVGTAT